MRVVSLLILVLCGFSSAVAPDISTATGVPAVIAAAADSDDAQYQGLQRQADLALDALRQSQERRLAASQIAAN